MKAESRADNFQRLIRELSSNPRVISAMPFEVFLELTTHCNFYCQFCPREMDTDILSGRTVSHLKAKLFHRLEPAFENALAIHSCGLGEPVLNRALPQLTGLARQFGFALPIRTNGSLLTPERALNLIEAGIGEVVFSIDGASDETFQRLRPPGGLPLVLQHLSFLASQREDQLAVHTVVTFDNVAELPALVDLTADCGVRRMTAEAVIAHDFRIDSPRLSRIDLEPMQQRASMRGVELSIRPPSPPLQLQGGDRGGPGLLGDARITTRASLPPPHPGAASLKAICPRPFTTAYVAADGRVGPCSHGLHRLGDLHEQPLSKIFAGAGFTELRQKMLDGIVPSECRACFASGRVDSDVHGCEFESITPLHIEANIGKTAGAASRPMETGWTNFKQLTRRRGSSTIDVDMMVWLRNKRPIDVYASVEALGDDGNALGNLLPPQAMELPPNYTARHQFQLSVPRQLFEVRRLRLRFLIQNSESKTPVVDSVRTVDLLD
jgi:MoaA/NifB/PqqE/SkfB family radical SAM enzyme